MKISACIGLALLATTTAASAEETTKQIDGIAVTAAADNRVELDAFIFSSEPKTITLDVETGEIVSVEAGIPESISYRTVCSSGDAYWGGAVPYANACFYGSSGTKSGNWVRRVGFYTGRYAAGGRWIGAGGRILSTGRLSPNTYIAFTPVTATAVSGTIY